MENELRGVIKEIRETKELTPQTFQRLSGSISRLVSDADGARQGIRVLIRETLLKPAFGSEKLAALESGAGDIPTFQKASQSTYVQELHRSVSFNEFQAIRPNLVQAIMPFQAIYNTAARLQQIIGKARRIPFTVTETTAGDKSEQLLLELQRAARDFAR